MKHRKAAMKAKQSKVEEDHRLQIKKLKEKHDSEIQDVTKFYRNKLNELKEKNTRLKIMVQEKVQANDNMMSLMKRMTPESYKDFRIAKELSEKKK